MDNTKKEMDRGASAATKNTDLTDSIHEDASADMDRGAKASTGMFSSKGAIGSQFTTDGAIGGTAQKIGGPLDKEGSIGKQFTEGGSIGGSVQNMLNSNKK